MAEKKKDELVAEAEAAGVEVDDKDTKADIQEKLDEAESGPTVGTQADTPDDFDEATPEGEGPVQSEASKQAEANANAAEADGPEQPNVPTETTLTYDDTRSAIYKEGAYPSAFLTGPGAEPPREPHEKDLHR